MAEAKILKLWKDYARAENTTHYIEQRKLILRKTVEKYLPKMEDVVKKSRKEGAQLLLCQDAFASEFQDDEILLLGMLVKYAGMYGLTVTIIP